MFRAGHSFKSSSEGFGQLGGRELGKTSALDFELRPPINFTRKSTREVAAAGSGWEKPASLDLKQQAYWCASGRVRGGRGGGGGGDVLGLRPLIGLLFDRNFPLSCVYCSFCSSQDPLFPLSPFTTSQRSKVVCFQANQTQTLLLSDRFSLLSQTPHLSSNNSFD